MASTVTEASPLLPQHERAAIPTTSQDSSRTVALDPIPRIDAPDGESARGNPQRPLPSAAPYVSTGQPVLTALHNKLRRRPSQAPYNASTTAAPVPKIGPQRTTKNTQKLKLLPNPETSEEDDWIDEAIPRDVYSQITRIKEPTARRDAARLGKADRDRLPRVTAYCTANSYRLDGVMRFLKMHSKSRGTNPKLIDECVYSPFNYDREDKQRHYAQQRNSNDPSIHPQDFMPSARYRQFSNSEIEGDDYRNGREYLTGLQSEGAQTETSDAQLSPLALPSVSKAHDGEDLDTTIHTAEVFLFDYGTVVIWGMTLGQETRFLNEVSKYANSVLSPADTQTENFNFYYARDYQARIYNDFISLRDPRSYMTKLAISHALSQSVKTSLFEDLVDETIATTSPLPAQIAQTGSVNLTRRQINMRIGELFILRINIHLQGSVLDSPELMWTEPQLDPVYQAVRSYLEMDQRVGLLTERLDVIADLLAVLKDQLSHRHEEYLEWIGKLNSLAPSSSHPLSKYTQMPLRLT